MHLVDVCALYTPQGGGVKTYVERKLRAGCAAGHDVTILAPGRKAGIVEVSPTGRIMTIPGRRYPLDGRYSYFHDEPALHATLDSLNPDFVEASSPWNSAVMVGRWRGYAPRALVMHSDLLSAYPYRWFGGFLSRQVIDRSCEFFWEHLRRQDRSFDMVICASSDLSQRLQTGGLHRTLTIPMGVEPGIFSPGLRDEALRRRLLARCHLPAEATLLVGVGRLAAEKRWPMVIDAVMAAGIDHPLGLILIGNGLDKAKVVLSAANNPHVQLLAPITDRLALARIMASSDALVHGCEAETFCMVASEARASGLPLIVPDQGGAADQIVPGQGATYRAGDCSSLGAALKSFMSQDPRGQRLRAAADAANVRSMDEHFDELFAAYQAAVTGPGTSGELRLLPGRDNVGGDMQAQYLAERELTA